LTRGPVEARIRWNIAHRQGARHVEQEADAAAEAAGAGSDPRSGRSARLARAARSPGHQRVAHLSRDDRAVHRDRGRHRADLGREAAELSARPGLVRRAQPLPLSAPRDPFDPLDGAVAATLDLHGYAAHEVEAAVRAFVSREARRSPGVLLHIITGRGRRSPGGPVLKPRVRSLLKAGALPVAAFGEDLDGGGFLVRLAPRR
jgi:hypothetical protein